MDGRARLAAPAHGTFPVRFIAETEKPAGEFERLSGVSDCCNADGWNHWVPFNFSCVLLRFICAPRGGQFVVWFTAGQEGTSAWWIDPPGVWPGAKPLSAVLHTGGTS